MLERGREFQPTQANALDPVLLDGVVRLARLAETVSHTLRDCPDASVRLSAAVLAARAHPILAAFDSLDG
jgi:hypothetical protein